MRVLCLKIATNCIYTSLYNVISVNSVFISVIFSQPVKIFRRIVRLLRPLRWQQQIPLRPTPIRLSKVSSRSSKNGEHFDDVNAIIVKCSYSFAFCYAYIKTKTVACMPFQSVILTNQDIFSTTSFTNRNLQSEFHDKQSSFCLYEVKLLPRKLSAIKSVDRVVSKNNIFHIA